MGYSGHVYGDSSPYQFHIPSATETQDGVMTKDQVKKLDSIPSGGGGTAVLAGDVTGPLSATVLSAIQGVEVDTTGHVAGDALVYNGTNDKIVPRAIADGINAFTTLTASFTQPAVGSTVTVDVVESSWVAFGQVLFVESGGYYQAAGQSPTHIVLRNLGYAGNASPAATIPNHGEVSPGGLAGPSNESSFGGEITTTPGGSEIYLGLVSQSNGGPGGVAGRVIPSARTFRGLTVALGDNTVTMPATTFSVTLYVSTNGGITYSAAITPIVINFITDGNVLTASFTPVVLAAGSVHVVGVKQLTGIGGYGGLTASVTLF